MCLPTMVDASSLLKSDVRAQIYIMVFKVMSQKILQNDILKDCIYFDIGLMKGFEMTLITLQMNNRDNSFEFKYIPVYSKNDIQDLN